MTKSKKMTMVGVMVVALLAVFALAGCASPETAATDDANNGSNQSSDNNAATTDNSASNDSAMGNQSDAATISDGTVLKVQNGWVAFSQSDMLVLVDSSTTDNFQWMAEIDGTSVLKDTDADLPSSTYNDQNASDVIGSPGMHVFGFLADKSGDSTITLKLADVTDSSNVKQTIVVKATAQDGMFTNVSVQES